MEKGTSTITVDQTSANPPDQYDLKHFQQCLQAETQLLKSWFAQHRFSEQNIEAGFEIEFWLLDDKFAPKPTNLQFVKGLGCPAVVPEVGAASLEINSDYQALDGKVFTKFHKHLTQLWHQCLSYAKQHQQNLIMIGMLPTATSQNFTPQRLTDVSRYHVLDQLLAQLRHHQPIPIDICGKQHLQAAVPSLAMNGSTSSFQLHLRVSSADYVRYYNSAQIITAPLLAISCNSLYLLGKALWAETRIPLFEQVMTVRCFPDHPQINYATFGNDYVRESLFELYQENLTNYPPLFPKIFPQSHDPKTAMHYVRAQNGIVYRWNRPVIGFDANGQPHLRIECRALPSGPSIIDMLANAALFYGLTHALAHSQPAPESLLSFDHAKRNFYQAAQYGMDAELIWLDQKTWSVQKLLLEKLLPLAETGLTDLGIDSDDIQLYLTIIADRATKNLSGSAWQQQFTQHHGSNFAELVKAIIHYQQSGQPMHTWPLK